MSTYARVAGLPVRVEGYTLHELTRPTSSGFQRTSVEIHLHGGGHTGRGEDAWYDEPDIARFLAAGEVLDLTGGATLDEVSGILGAADLVPGGENPLGRLFRRWGFEAALLDLALRQSGASLAAALDRTARPVDYLLSLRLGTPSTTAPLEARLALYPDLTFKLDPTNDWDRHLVDAVVRAAPGRVRSLDFKALYTGTLVDTRPDRDLYERCLAAWPDAWIEDPHLGDPDIAAFLAPHMDRVTWDAPIHTLEDVTSLAHTPRMVNIKPCRFGSLRALMAVYDHCETAGIGMYGGGFFEIGAGRGQIQYLASLFHPDAPNDVAPRGFHWPSPGPGIPPSPLLPAAHPAGFAWDDADPPPSDPAATA